MTTEDDLRAVATELLRCVAARYATDTEAIAAWNRRALLARPVDEPHEHGYECYFNLYGDKMDEPQCSRTPIVPSASSPATVEGEPVADPSVTHTPEYPTAWAYEQACKALNDKTERLRRIVEYMREVIGPEHIKHGCSPILKRVEEIAAERAEPPTNERVELPARFEEWALHHLISRDSIRWQTALEAWTGAIESAREVINPLIEFGDHMSYCRTKSPNLKTTIDENPDRSCDCGREQAVNDAKKFLAGSLLSNILSGPVNSGSSHGESAPEQKEENVARIYADGRWIHAECLLCAWSGVKWKAHKGSGLPNAKAILQHSLRDHLLFKHVEKLPVAPSVDTNAEPNCSAAHPERLQLHCMLIRGHDGDHANGYVVWPADAAQEPTCAAIFMVHMPQGYSKPMGRCGRLAGDPIHDPAAQSTSRHTFVESSVLPSKSERE